MYEARIGKDKETGSTAGNTVAQREKNKAKQRIKQQIDGKDTGKCRDTEKGGSTMPEPLLRNESLLGYTNNPPFTVNPKGPLTSGGPNPD